jgi:hypothetical protein
VEPGDELVLGKVDEIVTIGVVCGNVLDEDLSLEEGNAIVNLAENYLGFNYSVVFAENHTEARGRFPDVLSHPVYGMLWDDHTELELRPVGDLTKGFTLGLLRWDVNPIGTITDWYWSQRGGHNYRWNSKAKIATVADGKRWVIEYAIPLQSLRFEQYDDKNADGTPLVAIPPPDGTAYRAWFIRGIGGNGAFFNAFDNHSWNTTKTMLIFDSQAPAFQINELGPILDDIVDVQMTVKNHNTRSETLRIGFHMESAEGPIYSSYQSTEIPDGLIELRPGEQRRLRLRQPFPGISRDGNSLWFDVRSAGSPGKTLFRTRLIAFHSMEGGVKDEMSFRERRIDVIETLRPPRVPFDLTVQFCPYSKRMAAIVDRGIHGASEESQAATEARMNIRHKSGDNQIVHSVAAPFQGNFAILQVDAPRITEGESYEVDVLLFDKDLRIVGERTADKPFVELRALGEKWQRGKPTAEFHTQPWMNNDIGLEDRVWEPFTPIRVESDGFSTLKHRITIDASGLPAQIDIRPDPRELPLEQRNAEIEPASLIEIGRGPQLRAPLRLEAIVDGKAAPVQVVESAKAVRTGQSEIEYVSKLRAGPLDVKLATRYDCDGSLHAVLTYGGAAPARIDRLDLVMDIAGAVDLALSDTGGGGMTGADRWECRLSGEPGILWDSTLTEMPLFYSRFVPWFWFGSGDRGWSYYSTSAKGWMLDRDGSTMQLERHANGEVTYRISFVNHAVEVVGERTLDFSLLTHPAKPKPVNYRRFAWHHALGHGWATEYMLGAYDIPEAELIKNWRHAASAPASVPDSQRTEYRKDEPPFHRYGWWRNVQLHLPEMDQLFEDKATYYFERFIRIGRRVGWWMDEYWPAGFGISFNLATGNAYLREPEDVKGDELPWQPTFLTEHMRRHYKRISRVFAQNNVPQRQHTWSNNAAKMLESFLWSSLMVEECGGGIRAYEIDLITTFPNSLFRVMSKSYTGLIATMLADVTPAKAGDNPRFDRQRAGIGLINDFGVAPVGPHGQIQHKEQFVRLLDRLAEFGFFEDAGTEMLPYWRNDRIVRLGNAPGNETGLRVTAYRRPLEGGGYKAIFVLLNESDGDISVPLTLLDPVRALGGANTLTVGDILAKAAAPVALGELWTAGDEAARPALMDLETGGVVLRAVGDAEVYGPVFVPYHDYRILYGHIKQ